MAPGDGEAFSELDPADELDLPDMAWTDIVERGVIGVARVLWIGCSEARSVSLA
jgi:hypothetical protein